jgi:hypothetical protein
MPEKAKSWKEYLNSITEVASRLEPDALKFHDIDDVRNNLNRCLDTFEEDFLLAGKKLSRFMAFADFEDDKGRYIASLRNALAGWQKGPAPSIPAMIAAWYDLRGTGCEENAFVKASLIAGILAEIPVPAADCNGYHEHTHFREVTLLNMISLGGEEYIAKIVYPLEIAAKQVTIAAAHDLFHTGKDNSPDKKYVRYYLEQRSFDSIEPYLQECDLPKEDIEDIHIGILVTEIGKGDDRKYSAHQFLRQAYAYHFLGGEKPDLPEELKPLLSEEPGIVETRGRELTRICIRMQESDTVSSSLDQDSFRFRFMQLKAENPDKYPSSPSVSGFLQFLQYIFTSGKREAAERPAFLAPFFNAWFQSRLDKVREEAAGSASESE